MIYEFFGELFTDLFNGIYNQKIEPQKAKKLIITMASVTVVVTMVFSGINYFSSTDVVKKPEIQKIEKPKIKIKEEVKKKRIKK